VRVLSRIVMRKRVLANVCAGSIIFSVGMAVGFYELPPIPELKSIRQALLPSWRALSREGGGYYSSRRQMFEDLPIGQQVLMLGDSLTESGPWSELFPSIRIGNRGISGDTSAGARERLSNIVASRPKAVFVMVGINDLTSDVPLEAIIENVMNIAERLSAAEIKPFVQSTLFVRDVGSNGRILELNLKMQDNCQRRDIVYIDLNHELAPDGALAAQYTWDGVHLSGQGYLKWAEIITPHLCKLAASAAEASVSSSCGSRVTVHER
jgi:lysophospholipase L1-like esterase